MLVNPKLQRDPYADIMLLIGQGGKDIMLQEGVFLTPSFSFGHKIAEPHETYPEFDDNYEYSPYGVCDEAGQVLERYSEWLNDPERRFCISLTKITKSEEPSSGGWRWHKWGAYIGTKQPQYEYIYDEDDSIKEVYCYHIYELLSKAQ